MGWKRARPLPYWSGNHRAGHFVDNISQLSPARTTLREAATLDRSDQLSALTRACSDDLISAFGLAGSRLAHPVLKKISNPPARWLARQVATYDEIVGEAGLRASGTWALERMARRVEVGGAANVPREGPVLLVSNHPGLADAVALFSAIPREDLRVVAAKRPFLTALPNTSRHLITVPEDSSGRLAMVRSAAHHLRSGGAVLTFPGGRIEPDPAVLPGAVEALGQWSESVDLFARLVPGLVVAPVVVSGVLSPAALRNPFIWIRRRRSDREWLAATFQMLVPALRNVTTRVEFGAPVHTGNGSAASHAVLEEIRGLIRRCGTR
ncbi:MAG: 1-acyl-sn-glycerol-3-phosphate acyltransferase [Rubrobacter sp.]|nr:1-acyl-sn-glycerol-3-phosphate acyltransferase [Rubrobacter sp.]